MANPYFSTQTLSFLNQLASNNNRDWFNDNKSVYEDVVRTPALNFISDMTGDLALLSPHFTAQPKKVRGSLMRIYRDVRFGKDKRPYKTDIGIQFRHERGKDVHAPGFYLHIEPGECFVGVGIWRPDPKALGKIRERIDEKGSQWLDAIKNKKFKSHFDMTGESLKRPPRGYNKDHPLIEDLKRKDFIAVTPISEKQLLSTKLFHTVTDRFNRADDYMRFLCQALELQY